MKEIARNANIKCYAPIGPELKNFLREEKSQIALLGFQIRWTSLMSEGLERVAR
jgi:hypothetical protein